MKTVLWKGQAKDPFLPLRWPLRITSFCILPEKTVIPGISSSARATGMQPGAHVGKATLPAMAPAGTRGSLQLAASFWGKRGKLQPGKGLPSPQGGGPSHPTFLPEPTALASPPVLEGDCSCPPSCPAGTPSTRTPCKRSCDNSHQGASPGWACDPLVYNPPQGCAWPCSPGASIKTSAPTAFSFLLQSLLQRPLLVCKR